MSMIGYGHGSEWHLLRWLGYHRAELRHQVAESVGADDVEWLDLEPNLKPRDAFDRDLEWVNLDFLGRDDPARVAWGRAWPRAGGRVGPHWDAVGRARFGTRTEWLLVEAKAHLGEVRSDCGATSPKSIARIEAAFADAGPSFGVADTSSWSQGHYQLANRLTLLHVMNTNGAAARLVFVYFCGDDATRYGDGVECPPDAAGWQATLDEMHRHVGWAPGQGALGARVHELFLSVDAAGALGEAPRPR
jgi:hypothetical protein